jgi:hypothetical protein
MGGAEGKSDEQIAGNLGNPKTLARALKVARDLFIAFSFSAAHLEYFADIGQYLFLLTFRQIF